MGDILSGLSGAEAVTAGRFLRPLMHGRAGWCFGTTSVL